MLLFSTTSQSKLKPSAGLHLFLLAFVFITSCASQKIPVDNRDPFENPVVKDIQQVPYSIDLKQLIKSLPVRECPPPHCPLAHIDGWIHRMDKLEGDTLLITGDGEQIQLRISRLPEKDHYEVKGGSDNWPEGGCFLYKLKRLNTGWQVLSR